MSDGKATFTITSDMTLTIGLGLVVLFLLFVYFRQSNNTCAMREGLNNVPLNLSGAQHLVNPAWAPCGTWGGSAGPYNDQHQLNADKVDLEYQQKRGHKSNSFLPSLGNEYQNYMNLDKKKMSTPYRDEYNVPGDKWYPKPMNNGTSCP